MPGEPPFALRPEFTADTEKQAQWSAFSRRVELSPAVSLESITEVLRRFLLPPAGAAARAEPFERDWPAGGAWRSG